MQRLGKTPDRFLLCVYIIHTERHIKHRSLWVQDRKLKKCEVIDLVIDEAPMYILRKAKEG